MENENKNNGYEGLVGVVGEPGIPAEPDNGVCIGRIPTEAEASAMQLRLLMARTEGEDKCTLCM